MPRQQIYKFGITCTPGKMIFFMAHGVKSRNNMTALATEDDRPLLIATKASSCILDVESDFPYNVAKDILCSELDIKTGRYIQEPAQYAIFYRDDEHFSKVMISPIVYLSDVNFVATGQKRTSIQLKTGPYHSQNDDGQFSLDEIVLHYGTFERFKEAVNEQVERDNKHKTKVMNGR